MGRRIIIPIKALQQFKLLRESNSIKPKKKIVSGQNSEKRKFIIPEEYLECCYSWVTVLCGESMAEKALTGLIRFCCENINTTESDYPQEYPLWTIKGVMVSVLCDSFDRKSTILKILGRCERCNHRKPKTKNEKKESKLQLQEVPKNN